ncbi:MAG TPA: hypothetical protein VNJ71_09440 [Gemmatimonadales bacterium]|nr:hypothetical protein [Gemmatimonadales bacterium]
MRPIAPATHPVGQDDEGNLGSHGAEIVQSLEPARPRLIQVQQNQIHAVGTEPGEQIRRAADLLQVHGEPAAACCGPP